MTKKYLMGSALAVIGLCLSASVSLAAATTTATTTPAKIAKDPGVVKFVKIWAEASVLGSKIAVPVQNVEKQMNSLSSLKPTDYAAKLKVTNKSITEITGALALIDKQNAKLATLKKAAGTIKDVKVKASAQRLAGDYVAVYKALKDMIKAEKDVLLILKNELTRQSKGKTPSPDYLTKITALQKKINDGSASLGTIGQDATAAQTDFENATGVKLAK